MADAILALNAGSSSMKFTLFEVGGREPVEVMRGEVEGIGGQPRLSVSDGRAGPIPDRTWPEGSRLGHEAFLGAILEMTEKRLGGDQIIAFSHRVTHGGPHFGDPIEITPEVLQALDALRPLAPLHQPHNLAAVRATVALRPQARQIACFDTAFHRTMPVLARRLALPPSWEAQGVRRYGFHGLSYEFILGRLAELDPAAAGGKVIVAHLGSGASLCAAVAGRSIDTTMGFSALDGLVMGTRCGGLDPGVLLYMLQQAGLDAKALEDLLYHRSGLLGVSGLSSDMRVLLDSASPQARAAVDLFVYRLVRELGGLVASAEGLDSLVFTAGIGEHAPAIRERVCDRLAWLGVRLDPIANRDNAVRISAADSRVSVWVIPTDEERMLARHAVALMAAPTIDPTQGRATALA
jgi:acetate kinase